MANSKFTWQKKDVMGGRKCVINTRVPVDTLRSMKKMGIPATKIVEKHFPHLNVRVVRTILRGN